VSGLAPMIERSSVIVCCGSGGVGKTTMAAVIGLEAARLGRRAVVVTIDPARRLADALGLPDGLAGTPQRVDLGDHLDVDGGELSAMMLDAPATFDALVRRHAEDQDQVERILANRLYRNMVGAMSGTQEYMAAEMLHELHADDRFDLVVVDTPPSRNALDFLEAPDVLARFLDHRLFRLLMLPTRSGLRLLGTASQPMLRAIGRVVGSDVLADTVAFFQAFSGMEDGFGQRAREVVALIRAPETAFVVVASPRADTIDEAAWFTRQLTEQGVGVAGAVINRMHPEMGPADRVSGDEVPGADVAAGDVSGDDAGPNAAALGSLLANLEHLRRMRAGELEVAAPLIALVGADRVATMPLLRRDVHDLEGLCTIGDHLLR
jgi:anion-transporting  ArsA/GET3 family ATPase